MVSTDQKLPPSPPSYEELYSSPNPNIPSTTPQNNQNTQNTQSTNTTAPPNYYGRHSSQQNFVNNSNVPHHPGFTDPTPSSKNPDDSNTANLSLPWRYPKGYYCQKCRNTGYKTKNNNPCKVCWRHFRPDMGPTWGYAPKRLNPIPTPKLNGNVVSIPGAISYSYYPFSYSPVIRTINRYAPAPPPTGPLVVSPGDPRIGGILCSKCQGTGQTRFFLDTETCSQCRGMGRFGV